MSEAVRSGGDDGGTATSEQWRWQSGGDGAATKGSSGSMVLRTGSAAKGTGGSVSVVVGSGKVTAGGRITVSAGQSTASTKGTGGALSLIGLQSAARAYVRATLLPAGPSARTVTAEVAAAAETRIGEIERKLGSGIAGGVASAQLEETEAMQAAAGAEESAAAEVEEAESLIR